MRTMKIKAPVVAVSVVLLAALFSGCSPIPKSSYAAISFTPGDPETADQNGNSILTIIRDGKVVEGKPIKDEAEYSAKTADNIAAEYRIRFVNGSCSIVIYNGVTWITYVLSPDPCPPEM